MARKMLRLGEFRIDLERRLLYRDTQLLEPEPKEFGLLSVLIEAHPSTLSRRDLIDRLWPCQEIGDSALAQLIRRTRRLLGDDAQAPRYIRTVHGVGLRLIPTPEPESSAESAPPRIALLLSTQQDYLADDPCMCMDLPGLLIQRLETRTELHIQFIPGTEADQSFDARSLMHKHVCQALLQLSLLPDRLPRRLRFSLFSADPDESNEETTLEASSLLELIDKLATHLQERLCQNAATGKSLANCPGHSPDELSDKAYRNGLELLDKGRYREAEHQFRDALRYDDDFQWARVYLAKSLIMQDLLDEAITLIETLQSTPNQDPCFRFEVDSLMGQYHYSRGDYRSSARQHGALMEAPLCRDDPVLFAHQCINKGIAERALGNLDEARRVMQQALRASRDAGYLKGEGMALHNLGNIRQHSVDRCLDYFEQAELIFARLDYEHHQAISNFQIGTLLREKGELDRAREHFLYAQDIFLYNGDQTNHARARIELIHLQQLEGDINSATEAYEALIPELKEKSLVYPEWLAHRLCARAYLNLHQPDRARRHLEDDANFVPYDPSYHLLEAHCLFEERDFSAAVSCAMDIKKRLPDTWNEKHQRLLEGYMKAQQQDCWFELMI